MYGVINNTNALMEATGSVQLRRLTGLDSECARSTSMRRLCGRCRARSKLAIAATPVGGWRSTARRRGGRGECRTAHLSQQRETPHEGEQVTILAHQTAHLTLPASTRSTSATSVTCCLLSGLSTLRTLVILLILPNVSSRKRQW